MEMPLNIAGGEKVCKTCCHWRRMPTDPNNLREVKGECRYGPPNITMLPAPQGLMQLTGYPQVGPEFPACDRHEVKVLMENAA